ncbi:C40 family peptidase [Virgibacillus sp. LDC-1]|uniref:C40 family peptidase n=1 Tax=Virgibacillus sp. LDC-1 TaxID=3039856 RepID=UPI0024DE99D4|nr:C40 family peptidase [Virgibacillus sp. LDC-1]
MYKQTFDSLQEELWVTSVQVATVWTSPQSARDMDKLGLENPTNIVQWVKTLSYHDKLALCDENRVQTQLLFGEYVLVREIKAGWARIVIPSQPSSKDDYGYPGWVPIVQLKKVMKADWQREQTAVVKTKTAWLEEHSGNRIFSLSFLTALPVIFDEEARIKVKTPEGSAFLLKSDVYIVNTRDGMKQRSGQAIALAATMFIGLEYFWGGMSSFGYDCSGLAYAAYKANGYQISRDASDQAIHGEAVPLDQLRSGDLLFFAHNEGKGNVHHVGIYLGNGEMVHSPQTGKGIEITPLAGTLYEQELCVARRYWSTIEERRA